MNDELMSKNVSDNWESAYTNIMFQSHFGLGEGGRGCSKFQAVKCSFFKDPVTEPVCLEGRIVKVLFLVLIQVSNYTGGIQQRLDPDVHSRVTAKTSIVL